MAERSSKHDQTSSEIVSPIAISATFTAEPLESALQFWARELEWTDQIRFAPYHQVFQSLLDPASLFAANRTGVNVILARLEDWARSSDGVAASLPDTVAEFREAVGRFALQSPVPLLICFCPPSPAVLAEAENAAQIAELSATLTQSLEALPTVHVLTAQDIESQYPVSDYADPHADELGHVPYTAQYFVALGTAIARRIHALRKPAYKVVVLDCDDTLWQGICGEDGPQGIRLDEPRHELQNFMRAQRDAGMLLAICSKNNEEDVIETFRAHPEMPLRWEDFVAYRINWESKAPNLASLADELNLGLDSFLFVDDNPKECAEAKANRPEITPVALPAIPEEIPHFLRHFWAFDHVKTTAEDRARAALYEQERERGRLQRKATSLEEFVASLNLQVLIAPMQDEQLTRVSQLTQRTNQMNATTVRRAASEVQAFLRSGGECLTVEVSDRFGSYGLVGVILHNNQQEALQVDTFLLSCRALGRGVEHRMLAHLGQLAREKGLKRVEVPFQPTAKNKPALQFLESVSGEFRQEVQGQTVFAIPAGVAALISYRPLADDPGMPERETKPTAPRRQSANYDRIARDLSNVDRIAQQIRGPQSLLGTRPPYAAPISDIERGVAQLWEELLQVSPIGLNDNFFDLGGHSLLAVQLLSQVRQQFDADLSLEVVYSGTLTVAELAKAIELHNLGVVDAEEYAALLAEVEAMSDEEVRALLEAEDAASGSQA